MNLLYNLAINAYATGVRLASHRNRKVALMLAGQANTFNILTERRIPGERYVWIHASSLGEFEQGRPLIEMIKRNNPSLKVLLTFFSPSGYEIKKNYTGADVICYLPFDKPAIAKRFLDIARPEMAVFVKYEFWGNYLQELKQRNIPTYIISSIFREKQIFFRPWGGLFRKMLACFTHIFVQDEDSRRLLAGININNVTVAGDTRFDRVTDILAGCKPFPIVERFTSDSPFTLIIGSSWEPDEDIIIPYFNAHPDMKLIIAPHEFNKQRLDEMISKIKRSVKLYSQATEDNISGTDCLIIDCFGILSSCYRYANAAHIGGGFGVGIHNVNEAAVYSIPVTFGPNFSKFREARELVACEGAFAVTCKNDFEKIMDRFIADKDFLSTHGNTAGEYIKSHLGATKKIYSHIFG